MKCFMFDQFKVTGGLLSGHYLGDSDNNDNINTIANFQVVYALDRTGSKILP